MKASEETIAEFKVGDRCKCLSPVAFRLDAPFRIVSISTVPLPKDPTEFRYCYVVQYDDGRLDAIPVKNGGGYEIVKTKKAKPQ